MWSRRLAVVWLGNGLLLPACSVPLEQFHGSDAAPPSDAAMVDGPPQFTSCVGLAATCGPGANESCCQAAMVPGTDPGSMFYRGYDVAADNYDNIGYPATVSAFVLDKYEVTVGRFRAFVNAGFGIQESPPLAGSGAHPKLAGSGWDIAWNANLATNTTSLVTAVKCLSIHRTWTDVPGVNENKPMTCVTWYEAMAFCIWDGGYLPTELEWNYAASGGNEQRAYPWSNPGSTTTIDCTYANHQPGMYCANDPTGGTNRVGSESAKGDGRWGHADLAGNAWEWTLDWYASTFPLPCNDCANLTTSSYRVIRGGGFASGVSYLRTAFRDYYAPTDRFTGLFGLRCARAPWYRGRRTLRSCLSRLHITTASNSLTRRCRARRDLRRSSSPASRCCPRSAPLLLD
jgi:formylglycine-generating enzyme